MTMRFSAGERAEQADPRALFPVVGDFDGMESVVAWCATRAAAEDIAAKLNQVEQGWEQRNRDQIRQVMGGEEPEPNRDR